jgi:hypothetical protein
MSTKERRADEQALITILDQIEVGNIQVHRNILGQPYVFCDHPDHPSIHLQLFDRDFRGWFSNFIWEECKILPREREIDRILELMAGRSLQNHISTVTDPALLQVIEKEPVVAVTVEFMHGRTRIEASMEGLWKQLRAFAKERAIGGQGRVRFPAGANVLSRKLRQLTAVFSQLGIDVDIHRSNGSKVILTGRVDGSEVESSAESSADKGRSANELDGSDDRSQRLASLEARKKISTPLDRNDEGKQDDN